MLEQLMTRRKLILLASVSSFLSGCSMFSSDRYSYQPVSYDNSEGSKVLRTAMSQYGAKYKYGKASPRTVLTVRVSFSGLTANTELPFPATPPLNQKPANGWLPATPGRAILLFSGSADDSTQAWSLIKGASFMHPLPAVMSEWKVSPVSTGKTRSSDTAESCKANDIILKNHIVT